MKDVTNKYEDMIHSFDCDFFLASNKFDGYNFSLEEIQEQIDNNLNPKLNYDIELLNELSFKIRHGDIKIYEKNMNFT